MKTTDVFSQNIKAYNRGDRLIVNKGSSRSSKTYSVLQLLYLIAKHNPKSLVISVVSRALPHLKSGAMRDFDNILIDEGEIPDKIKNKSESYYNIGKSIIEFFGADQQDKVHGPSRDILFINEAYFIKYEVYNQLSLRTSNAIFIDYNPIQRYWLDDDVIPNEETTIIHSTYKNNQYCPKGIRSQLNLKLERYNRETANKTIKKSFKNWCKVYLFGEDGVLEGVIFDNWRYEAPGEVDRSFNELSSYYGLDYGYFPDPDAMSKNAIDVKRKIIYTKEYIYETNNGTDDLIAMIKKFYQRGELIVAESASPRTNKDLGKYFNLVPVIKTKTVKDWIREMQDYEIVVGLDSYNTARELQNYVWSDKRAGIPVDEYNHLIDEIRYCLMEKLMVRGGMRRVN